MPALERHRKKKPWLTFMTGHSYSKIWSFEVVFWPYKIRHNSKFIEDLKLENVSAYWQDDEDVYILSKISDIVHALFGTKGADFLPVFDQLLELFVRLLKPDSPWPDRQWGICIFDDLLEYTGPVSVTTIHSSSIQLHKITCSWVFFNATLWVYASPVQFARFQCLIVSA